MEEMNDTPRYQYTTSPEVTSHTPLDIPMSEEELARRRVMQEAIDTYVINPEDTDSHRVEGHGASMLAAAKTQMAYEMTHATAHEAQFDINDPHQLIRYGKSVIALRQYTKEHVSRSDFNLTA